jgi:hypothetical protein
MNAEMNAGMADDELDCTRLRALNGVKRCVALLLDAIGRDWRHCGKASCARARRCRGFACELEDGEE